MKRILLPVDGSDTCMKSYEYAKDFAQKYDSEIIILYSYDTVPPFGWVYDTARSKEPEEQVKKPVEVPAFGWIYDSKRAKDLSHDVEKNAENIVEKAREYFKDTDIKIKAEIVTGDPAVTIIEIAEKEECDMIIMCTHGMSASKRFLLGSVTNKVVHHAKTPVLVVR